MKIGIIGAGNVGRKLEQLAELAGHDVQVGSRSGAVSPANAARHGEIVILAVPYTAAAELLRDLAPVLAGRILIDATNPLNEDWSPLALGLENSAAEEIARLLPGIAVVKAFNTIFADVMSPDRLKRAGQLITAFVASDDVVALDRVAGLAAGLGFAPVTVNKLSAARYLEAMAHLNIELAVGQGGGTDAAFLYHRG